ncbi:MAG TPA: hypothetical protein VJG66_04090 [Patescibacteria group bacterium]|nr:hypothetical protein [Patescibacteria group bacterium]
MQNMTTTDLRTKSSELVKTLKEGRSVDLIHRSEVIGEIKPKIKDPKPFDAEKFKRLLKLIKPKKTIPRSQREKVYRRHLMEKYGKGLS